MSDQIIQPAAQQLHNEARALGQAGNYDEAIAKLESAMQIDPHWAYPVYDLAFTWLLKGDTEKALEYYQQTDSMKPMGFFTTKTAVYSLEGEKSGKFPAGLYMAYMQSEWTDDPALKMQIIRAITEQVPDYAPAWKELANLSDDNVFRLEIINTGLSKEPDAETENVLLLNKAMILHNDGKDEEAKQILNGIIAANKTTSGVEIANHVLASFSN